jgi:hypothetical protein
MRFLVIALAAALLALPAVTPASACGAHTAKATTTTNYSAKKKTTKKMAKKTVKKKRKAKVEYMRIAPYK